MYLLSSIHRTKYPVLIRGVSILGSGDINGKSKFVTDNFYADISGSSDICMELEVNRLESEISGCRSINLVGTTWHHDATITGSIEIEAFELDTKNVSIKISYPESGCRKFSEYPIGWKDTSYYSDDSGIQPETVHFQGCLLNLQLEAWSAGCEHALRYSDT